MSLIIFITSFNWYIWLHSEILILTYVNFCLVSVSSVIIDKKEYLLKENQSTYIPVGSKHRLSNNEVFPLKLIEVQCGNYLGEDDIFRFDDNYGRIN